MRTTTFRTLLGAGASVLALAAHPAWAGEVAGTVVDQSRTVALQSAQVRIVELGRAAVTGSDGGFVFGDVPEGTYTVEARFVGAEPETQSVTVPATGLVRADFALGGGDGGQILVVGQSANLANALSRKQAADGVSDVLTRDAIGQFPDQNVAESLRRLPGVNVLNDQGEGRFVAVRGLDPELNATSLNGVRLPAPEADIRAVALDVVSSDIIESIEVKKSLTPDMDADTIGASIEINTVSPFKRKKDLWVADIEGSWNDYSGKVTPKGSFDFATRLGDSVGISGGASYYMRKFETDNMESDPWVTSGDGVVYSENVDYRDYDVKRTRINAALGFDFLLSPTTTAYIKGNWSQFDDHEYKRGVIFVLGEPNSGDADSAQFSDADERIEIRKDLKDRFERQQIKSVVIGSDTDTGDWTFKWSGSYAKSLEIQDMSHPSLDPTRFRARFDDDGVDLNFDYSDPRLVFYDVTSGADLVNDASNYGFNRIELTALSDSHDEEWALKGDLARHFAMNGGEFTVQAGAKGRWRDKSFDFDLDYYGDYNGDYTLADVLGEQTYRILDLGPVPSHTGPAKFFSANAANFELDPFESALGSASDDYSVSEDIAAGYLLGRWDSDTLRVIGGVRYEHTRNGLTGNNTLIVDEGGTLPDGTTAGEDTVIVSPVAFRRNYDDWLPSLTLRYAPAPDLVLRAAGYRSLVRPKLSKLAPRFGIEESDDGDIEADFGNPDLKPYRAWNLDLAAEYYMSSTGGISAGFFYKDIKDYIVDTFSEDGVFRGVAYDEATIPLNGPSAEVYGAEFSYSQNFTMLPAPFDGLIGQVNYTWTHSRGDVPTEGDPANLRRIPLPATSRNTFNVVLGYEKGPFEFRAAGTYRDKYLDELGETADMDRYVDNHFQLDLSTRLRVTKNVRLFAEWINVNNAKYFAYHTYGGRRRLLQYEEYGPTVKFGAKVNF